MARLAALLVVAALAGCAPGIAGPTYPPEGVTPPPVGDATRVALNQVVRALADVGLQAGTATTPYRPPEAARLAAAPRMIVQVTLPEDPQRGLLVLYELGTPEAATAAAEEQAAYVATGPGRIQFPPAARFVLRVSGATVVFFTWLPGSAGDPRTGDIARALETIGTGVPVGS
ncbi:MAG TPA: hypothetical protein VK831_05175 [Candidatus Deferrimicrobiaceae bacterium]|nr:hypothetical protein [Candidatus Deferrimicrobiaceae bacterium]